MATYKVPQDVEAEDHLIGNVTFKQFIYLIIAVMGTFIGWALFNAHPLLSMIPLPVVIVFGILGAYSREDQPVESYALAFLNFTLKPRRRLWKNGGTTQNVKIKAPKRAPRPAKETQSSAEARSQLQQLAQVVDTRGWSVKRPELTEPIRRQQIEASDRIVVPESTYSQDASGVGAEDDIFEGQSQAAENIQTFGSQTTNQARQAAISRMQQAMEQGQNQAQAGNQAAGQRRDPKTMPRSSGGPTSQLRPDPYPAMHQKVINPSGSQTQEPPAQKEPSDQPAPAKEKAQTQTQDQSSQPKQGPDEQQPKDKSEPSPQAPPTKAKAAEESGPDQAQQNDAPQQGPDPDDIVRLSQSDIKISEIAKQANREPQEEEGQISEGEEVSLR